MKRTVLLCDSDREYAERVAEFARNGMFRKEVEITVCTRPELFVEWLRDGKYDVYVASVEVASAAAGGAAEARSVVWIGERGGRFGPGGAAVMNKYEAAPKLLRAWLDRAPPAGSGGTGAVVVGVWSVAGGVGKTRLTRTLAVAWTRSGIRCFVAGFDPGGTADSITEGAAVRDVSDWLYAIKSGRPILEEEPGDNRGAMLRGFGSSCSERERASIDRREGEALLEAAASDVGDGIVLADAGTGWSPWAEAVWGRSDGILCVASEEPTSLAKTEKWLRDWPEWEDGGAYRSKTKFVLNRCLEREGAAAGWLKEAFRLPYVPEWKQDPERRDPSFQRAGERLAEEARAAWAARRI